MEKWEQNLWLRRIAQENEEYIARGGYEADGVRHDFSPRIRECLLFPEEGHGALLEKAAELHTDRTAEIRVVAGDTLAHAEEVVLNFADAYEPGGLYFCGSTAQEECLCRASTLYASITAREAMPLYDKNRHRRGPESDDFLISPYVEIFRSPMDEGYELLPEPRVCAVITSAAPDLHSTSLGLPEAEVRATLRRRMRAYLAAAAIQGYRTVTLGAWGCGAFGHDAASVAEDFRTVLVDEGLQTRFDRITFAIYGEDETGRYNRQAFEEAFKGLVGHGGC